MRYFFVKILTMERLRKFGILPCFYGKSGFVPITVIGLILNIPGLMYLYKEKESNKQV